MSGWVIETRAVSRLRFDLRRGVSYLPIAGVAMFVGLLVAGALQAHRPIRAEDRQAGARVEIAVPPRSAAMALIPPSNPMPAAAAQAAKDTAPTPGSVAPAAVAEHPASAPQNSRAQLAATLIPPSVPTPETVIADQPVPLRSSSMPSLALTKPAVAAPTPPATRSAAPAESAGNLAIAAAAPPRPERIEPPPADASADQPWRLYAQPFDPGDKRPRIALIVAGIDDDMESALESLPRPITLALDPYSRRLPEWIELARSKGHEVLLTLSLPALDRGRRAARPMAILSSLDPKENLERLDWALSRANGFIGVLDLAAARAPEEQDPILATLQNHGLMLIEGPALGLQAKLPLARGDVVLAPEGTRELEKKLGQLTEQAAHDGRAMGIVLAKPSTLGRIAEWVTGLTRKGIAVAPASVFAAAKSPSEIARQ